MFGAPSHEELIRLRINLMSMIQWTERLTIAQMTLDQKRKTAYYSPDQIQAGEKEVKHARYMARTAAAEVLPVLEELSKEMVTT